MSERIGVDDALAEFVRDVPLSDSGCVVLIGSRARGDWHPGSDYDLVFIDPAYDGVADRSESIDVLSEARGMNVDRFLYTPDEFKAFAEAVVTLQQGRREPHVGDRFSLVIHTLAVGQVLRGAENFAELRARYDQWVAEGRLPKVEPLRFAPSLADGLIDVQREILERPESRPSSNRNFRKSIVCLTDASETTLAPSAHRGQMMLYAMAQPFRARYPLFETVGNFGSLHGDRPAAVRYTELRPRALLDHGWVLASRRPRLEPLPETRDDPAAHYWEPSGLQGRTHAQTMENWKERRGELNAKLIRLHLDRLRERAETIARRIERLENLEVSVDSETFWAAVEGDAEVARPDEEREGDPFGRDRPRLSTTPRPLLFPVLLANGTIGLPGVTCCFPPHLLEGIADALTELTRHPNASDEAVVERLGLPDFATGGRIVDPAAAREAQLRGRGDVVVEAVFEVSQNDTGPTVTLLEVPPEVFLRPVIRAFREAQHRGHFAEGITFRDDSRGRALRVEFQLEPGTDPHEFQAALLEHTGLRRTIAIDMHGYEDGEPVRTNSADLVRRVLARHRSVLDDEPEVRAAITELRRWSDPRRTS